MLRLSGLRLLRLAGVVGGPMMYAQLRSRLHSHGYDIDVEKVVTACAEHSVAVEINANPSRLDLDWRWHETALRLGCIMSIQSGRAFDPRGPHAFLPVIAQGSE